MSKFEFDDNYESYTERQWLGILGERVGNLVYCNCMLADFPARLADIMAGSGWEGKGNCYVDEEDGSICEDDGYPRWRVLGTSVEFFAREAAAIAHEAGRPVDLDMVRQAILERGGYATTLTLFSEFDSPDEDERDMGLEVDLDGVAPGRDGIRELRRCLRILDRAREIAESWKKED